MSASGRGCVAFAALMTCILASDAPVFAGSSNSLLDISTDGQLLACANRDAGTVTVIDLKTLNKLREIAVGEKPEGITFLGSTHTLACAVYAEDQITICDADSGKIETRIPVFDEPYGLVSNAAGSRLYATLEYPGRVVEIDTRSRRILRQIAAGRFVRGIALSQNEQQVYVTEYYSALVRAIDLGSAQAVDEWPAASTDNLARQLIVHPLRPKIYLSHIRSRVTAAHGEGSIFPYLTVLDTNPNSEKRRRKRIPMDSFVGNRVTANPWEVTVSPDGQRLFIVFSGTDDMFVCQLLDDNYREVSLIRHMRLGHNPRAVRVSPDSKRVFVYNALDFEVSVFDVQTLKQVARIPTCDNPLTTEVLRGKILFYTSLQPMTGRRWISCSSCHPDGDADGRTWQNPEGLRSTPPLFGLSWTHPLHWSSDRDEVQDFEHTIRGQLMQGRGLIVGKVQPQLGSPNGGLSADLDAVAAYTNSHKFTLSPHAAGGLSSSAERGRALFFSKKTGCASCHSGPFFTDSRPDNNHLRHDVGTGGDDPSEKMGPRYDTPTLIGVYRSAPYLHHGRAATLEDVLTTNNRGDRHGKTSHLQAQQIKDLVEFLKCLPYTSPSKQAQAAQMKQVIK